MTEVEQAQAKLDSLLIEKKDVEAQIASSEDRLKKLNQRLSELRAGWHSNGEIGEAKLAVRDASFPIFEPQNKSMWSSRNLRIIGVTDKTITMREDGMKEDDVKRYSIATGKPPNSKYYSSIDVEKALRIWKEHQAKQQNA